MTVSPRLARAARYVVIAACLAAALSPLFASRDLPLIDLPAHLGSVHIWNHHDEARYGYDKYYRVNLEPVPYWAYYGFVHTAAYVMPLRWANKAFIALSMIGAALGLAALLRAHGRPPELGLVALALGWNHLLWWGFLAFVGGIGPLFYGWALLARMADARPWPSWRLLAANVAMGFVLYFFHPLIFLLWLVGVAVYAWGRLALVALPSFVWFGVQFGHTKHVGNDLHIQGIWDKPRRAFRLLWHDNVHAFLAPSWRTALIVALLATGIAAAFLTDREARASDRRPWKLLAAVAFTYFALPHHLEQPLGFAVMNIRVAVILVLAAFVCVPAGVLTGWRRAVVCAPLVVIIIAHSTTVAARFARFDRHERDFYAVVEALPYDPKVLTLIYDRYEDSVRSNIWGKFAAYVQVERGGWDAALFDASQGIGESGFPVKPLGAGPPAPALNHAQDFKWDKHAAPYDYFLTRGEPAGVFSKRAELELVIERGAFRLWKRRAVASAPP